jgi:hypothetical protein
VTVGDVVVASPGGRVLGGTDLVDDVVVVDDEICCPSDEVVS